jgi:hypothetical protein
VSVNKERPHVLVLPEDDANRQLATGFHLEVDWNKQRQMQVLPVAGGWLELVSRFKTEHIDNLVRYPERNIVLILDFDAQGDRLDKVRVEIPKEVFERVFVLGVWSEPEALKKAALGSYEDVGSALAKDCRDRGDSTWKHQLLRHNSEELRRLNERVRPFLF